MKYKTLILLLVMVMAASCSNNKSGVENKSLEFLAMPGEVSETISLRDLKIVGGSNPNIYLRVELNQIVSRIRGEREKREERYVILFQNAALISGAYANKKETAIIQIDLKNESAVIAKIQPLFVSINSYKIIDISREND